MNITELVKLNQKNGGFFFDPKSMKAAGETQKTWSIQNNKTEKTVTLTDKRNSSRSWTFSTITGRVVNFN